jgi:sulfatase modifying factor 1
VSRYCRLFGICAVLILAAIVVGPAQAVTIATVPVGYAGNAPDTQVMNDGTTGYGAVPYNYRIGTYDVTNAQYVEFLNAKASAADPFGLWSSDMALGYFDVGISRSASAPYVYTLKQGYGNKPVVYVSWFDAIRFVNWLTNGQGNGDTESGTYLITGGGNNSGIVAVPNTTQRTAWAATKSFHWLLPDESEWYKAAYYNGSNGTYYAYSFRSNSQPMSLAPPGNTESGNFTSSAFNIGGILSLLTDVGAYPNSLSPFGLFDMGGDVFQWNDTAIQDSTRGLRGGGCLVDPSLSAATFRGPGSPPSGEGGNVGFRIAIIGDVPEPSTGLLAILACGMIWLCRKRFKRPA